MHALNQLRVGTRLAAAFSLLALMMLAIVGIAVAGLSTLGSDIHLMVNDRYAKVKLVNEIQDELNQQARSTRNLLIMDSEVDRNVEIALIATSRATAAERYARLVPLVTSDHGKALLADVHQKRAGYMDRLDPFIKTVQGGDLASAKQQLLSTLRPQQLAYVKSLGELIRLEERLMDDTSSATAVSVQRISMELIVAALAALLLAVAAAVVVTRSVVRPLDDTVATLQAVAKGDLAMELRVDRGDEIGMLQSALSVTVQSLRELVHRVRSGVESVATASSQIATGNQDLSGRTEQQAASLEETASSMEQLTATVRQSAEIAQQACQLATDASNAAARGGESVGSVISTMNDITDSSRRISEITGVIDAIAFQTNILALNAAVEAARAGEQGRGFAVVASEVRTLARRSGEAAREIKALIGNSVDRVEVGSRQVVEAGDHMNVIVAQVRRVTELITDIASAAREQSDGILQVNQAVAQMDQVTQQNAALVEQSAAAAASLSLQAQGLSEAVAAFNVEGAGM